MIGTASRRNGARQRIALLLVVCALLFRAAVPAGWMPQFGTQGVTLSWCSGMGGPVPTEAKAMIARAIDGHEAPKQKPAQDQPCAFAAAAMPMAMNDQVSFPAPVVAEPIARDHVLTAAPGLGLAAPPPLSTGPPTLA